MLIVTIIIYDYHITLEIFSNPCECLLPSKWQTSSSKDYNAEKTLYLEQTNILLCIGNSLHGIFL